MTAAHSLEVRAEASATARRAPRPRRRQRLLRVVGRRDRRRQLDAGQVVGVLALLVDRGARPPRGAPTDVTSLPASASTSENAVPHEPAPNTATLLMRVSCFRGSFSCGLPVSRHAGLARVEALGRRLLAAEVLDERGDRGHDPVGRLAAAPRWCSGWREQVVEVDRVAGLHRDRLAREQVRPSCAYGAQQLLRTPLADRDHRARRSPARSGRHRSCRSSATGRGRG